MTFRILLSYAALTLAGLFPTAVVLAPSAADAAACGSGVYRAGCVGPNGAVVVKRPVATTTTTCRFINGVRVCKRVW